MKKLLIVYYSWSCGNTERIAKALQHAAGGDLWKLDTAEPYRGSYSEVVDQGQREVERGFEPELKPLGVDPAEYDCIAVGTPTWWYTMAPAVKTFLNQQQFSGKTVIPCWRWTSFTGRGALSIRECLPSAPQAVPARQQIAPNQMAVQQHGQQEAQHHDDQHVEHGEDHGVPQGDAEGGITENDLVVFQPGKVERPEAVPAQRYTFPQIICLPCLCASFRWALWIA